jgi:hypothetical protein
MQLGTRAMKTTVEVPENLYRRAKAEAALRGRKLKDLIEEGCGSCSTLRANPVGIRALPA